MSINRSDFKITNPDYIALKNWIHNFLDDIVFKYTNKQYYQKGRENRKKEEETDKFSTLNRIVTNEIGNNYRLCYQELPEKNNSDRPKTRIGNNKQ